MMIKEQYAGQFRVCLRRAIIPGSWSKDMLADHYKPSTHGLEVRTTHCNNILEETSDAPEDGLVRKLFWRIGLDIGSACLQILSSYTLA